MQPLLVPNLILEKTKVWNQSRIHSWIKVAEVSDLQIRSGFFQPPFPSNVSNRAQNEEQAKQRVHSLPEMF